MKETPNARERNERSDYLSDCIAAVIIKGKFSGEIPSVSLSNRKTTTHFKGRGIFIPSTENCQLTLTFLSLFP